MVQLNEVSRFNCSVLYNLCVCLMGVGVCDVCVSVCLCLHSLMHIYYAGGIDDVCCGYDVGRRGDGCSSEGRRQGGADCHFEPKLEHRGGRIVSVQVSEEMDFVRFILKQNYGILDNSIFVLFFIIAVKG